MDLQKHLGSLAAAIVVFGAVLVIPAGGLPPDFAPIFDLTGHADGAVQNVDTVDRLADPLELLGSYPLPGPARGVAVVGNTAYVAVDTQGLFLVDVTDPSNPVGLGSFDSEGAAWRIDVAGDYACVAARAGGLRIVSVADPMTPDEVGSYTAPGTGAVECLGIAARGTFAFVAELFRGFHIVDFTDPANPQGVGHYATQGAQYVQLAGDYGFVASGSNGLRILNIADPAHPALVGFYTWSDYVGLVRVAGDYAVVTTNTDVIVLNVADLAHPARLGRYRPPGRPDSLAVLWPYAFVGAYAKGLRVLDLSDPAQLVELGWFDTVGIAWGVEVQGDLVYVAAGDAGLLILRASVLAPARPQAYLPAIGRWAAE